MMNVSYERSCRPVSFLNASMAVFMQIIVYEPLTLLPNFFIDTHRRKDE